MKTSHNIGTNTYINQVLDRIFGDLVKRYISEFNIIPCLGEKEIIVVQNPNENPKCLISDLPNNYKIQITDYDSGDYSKIAFQFSHELGHIFCGPNTNNWLIETACEFISIDSMKYLSKSWVGKSDLKDSKGNDFSPHFESYIDNEVHKSFQALGMTEQNQYNDVIKCFIENSPPTYARDFNRIIAKRLFNQFQTNPKDILYLFSKLSKLTLNGQYQITDFWENTQPDLTKIEEIFPGLRNRILTC